MSEAKPYDISKRLVWDAWEQVKENHGAAGVDGVSIAAFEKDPKTLVERYYTQYFDLEAIRSGISM